MKRSRRLAARPGGGVEVVGRVMFRSRKPMMFLRVGEARWHERARQAFEWFVGRNELHRWVYDPATGGCRDGLHVDRVNENQGAESTLSFLMALLDMRQVEHPAEVRSLARAANERSTNVGVVS